MNITLCQIVFYKPVKISLISFLHSELGWQYQQHLGRQDPAVWVPTLLGDAAATLRDSPAGWLPGGVDLSGFLGSRRQCRQKAGRQRATLGWGVGRWQSPPPFRNMQRLACLSRRRPPPGLQVPVAWCGKSSPQVDRGDEAEERTPVPTLILMAYLDWYNESRDLVSQCCRINVITVTEILFS